MVQGIRNIELVLGDGLKGPRPSEVGNKLVARKSLVAEKVITKGATFSKNNLSIKRPGSGMNPIHYWQLLGKEAKKNYQIGELIDE